MNIKIIKLVSLIALLTAGSFSCTKDDDPDDNLVSIRIENFGGEVDPYIVSFALPGIVDAKCYKGSPYLSCGGIPETMGPNDWSIHLVMEKGTDRTKLAPIITLAPGATITPKSGTVLDFSKNIEWNLTAADGSTAKYYMAPVFVMGDKDENNMVSIKIRCLGTGAIDPNIVSFALPGIVDATIYERPPYPDYGGDPNVWSPHFWSIGLGMAKVTDCTKLAPIITLAPGARIKEIYYSIGEQVFSKQVDYTGIAKVGAYDFTRQVDFILLAPDGSTVFYNFLAHAY